jgi:hypothetical protein
MTLNHYSLLIVIEIIGASALEISKSPGLLSITPNAQAIST